MLNLIICLPTKHFAQLKYVKFPWGFIPAASDLVRVSVSPLGCPWCSWFPWCWWSCWWKGELASRPKNPEKACRALFPVQILYRVIIINYPLLWLVHSPDSSCLVWQGAPGERGAPGAMGAQGATGESGSPGAPGAPGSKVSSATFSFRCSISVLMSMRELFVFILTHSLTLWPPLRRVWLVALAALALMAKLDLL